jgi:putative oxygen-independent coproporphyrinogen III oxidase
VPARGPFGVYVHIPFCSRRCDYCAFATWTDRHHLMGEYVAALIAEIDLARAHGGHPPATSVFFGGGTPSLLPAADLCRVLDAIERVEGAEVTVECNPDTVTEALLAAYERAGVTRISLGVQSMRPHVLAGLGREHRPEAVLRSVELLGGRSFASYNVDLIYGAAGETDADWISTLEQVLALAPPPPHVSAYALTVEAGTPLARDSCRHPDDDVQARRYEIADALLAAAGLAWYEISNWASPGHECRHNQTYWQGGDYRGYGCAAHSHSQGRRWWNVRTPERYIRAVRRTDSEPRPSCSPALGGEERLSPAEVELERLELALRTSNGVPAASLPDEPDLSGLVTRSDDRAVLTIAGRLLANEVTIRLQTPSV